VSSRHAESLKSPLLRSLSLLMSFNFFHYLRIPGERSLIFIHLIKLNYIQLRSWTFPTRCNSVWTVSDVHIMLIALKEITESSTWNIARIFRKTVTTITRTRNAHPSYNNLLYSRKMWQNLYKQFTKNYCRSVSIKLTSYTIIIQKSAINWTKKF